METPLSFSLHGCPLAYFGDSPILMLERKLKELLCASSFLSYLSIQILQFLPCSFSYIHPHLLIVLSPGWLQISFSSQSSVLETAALLAASAVSAPAACCPDPHRVLVLISGDYIKCSLNILRSIRSNLVRTERGKANIYLLSCHFAQINELNIFIALKINYLLSPGQLLYSSCIFCDWDLTVGISVSPVLPPSPPTPCPNLRSARFLNISSETQFRGSARGVWPAGWILSYESSSLELGDLLTSSGPFWNVRYFIALNK